MTNKKTELSEEAKRIRREYLKQWRDKNREHVREYHKQWRKRNPDHVCEYRKNYWERKAERADQAEG